MPTGEKLKLIIEIGEHGRPIVRQVAGDFERLADRAHRTGRAFQTIRRHWLALSAAMAAGIYATIRIGKSFIQAAGESESFQAQLMGVSKSMEEATKAYKQMLDFAARTPHMTQDVVAAFIMLRSVGLKPSIEDMKTLGDVAFLFNRNIQDVSSALISFEKEVLRRLGVEIDRTGDKVKIMSDNMIIETENAAEAIRAGLLYVWETRFGGTMEKSESTWRSLTALFHSRIWEMRKDIGATLLPGFKLIVQEITNIIVRIKDWAKINREATRDIMRHGILEIITGLKYLSYAVQLVTEIWFGWREILGAIPLLLDTIFKHANAAIRSFLEKINFRGVFDEWIHDIERTERGFEIFAEKSALNLDKIVMRHEAIREGFSKMRAELNALGETVENLDFSKLSALAAGDFSAAWTGRTGGAGAPPTAPGWLDFELEALEDFYTDTGRFRALQAEVHDERMYAWQEEIEKMSELMDSQHYLRDSWLDLLDSENAYLSFRGAIKRSIQDAILGYDSLGSALKRAVSEVLSAIATEAGIRAIYNLAMGIYNLAVENYEAATKHFMAAAMFAAVAASAGAVARAVAPTPTAGAAYGYYGGGAGYTRGVSREGETAGYAQKWEVTILNPIGEEAWLEDNILPLLKKVAKRDTEIVIRYGD